jgi:hypothetical protein
LRSKILKYALHSVGHLKLSLGVLVFVEVARPRRVRARRFAGALRQLFWHVAHPINTRNGLAERWRQIVVFASSASTLAARCAAPITNRSADTLPAAISASTVDLPSCHPYELTDLFRLPVKKDDIRGHCAPLHRNIACLFQEFNS